MTFTDVRGHELQIAAPPGRIVSIAPSNVELLYAIGAGDLLAGRDDLSDYPPEASEIPSVGTPYGDLNLEALVALEPDLVLAAEINPPEQVAGIRELDIPTFVVPNPVDFEHLFDIIALLGEMTARVEQAAALNEELSERVERVEQRVAGLNPVRSYYEIDGTDPTAPYTTGSGTFQHYMIQLAGGENIAADLDMWGTISAEEIVTRDPEVIVFEQAPWIPTTPETIGERPGWSEIAAVQQGRIEGIDTNLMARPGPRLVEGLEVLAGILHPAVIE
jgi:iron complex transport system substrate-binding protein